MKSVDSEAEALRKFGWDDEIPHKDREIWTRWLSDLPVLSQLKVDRRWIPQSTSYSSLVTKELHHFADASSRGYGVVSYLRVVDEAGDIHCSILMAKARLAPIKAVSIPRLELMAATLAVKVDQFIRNEISFMSCVSIFWTDSSAVLSMVKNTNRRFPVFVANRLTKIEESSDHNQWRFVNSEMNVADHASRGMSASTLLHNSCWFKGPDFLWMSEEHWPVLPHDLAELPEEFLLLKCHVAKAFLAEDGLDRRFERFSSLYRLQKSVAWLLRLKGRLLKRSVEEGPLTVDEIERALAEIIKIVQRRTFHVELRELEGCATKTRGRKVGRLRKLNPMLKDGILRVGGRLDNAPLEFSVRHPIILPSDHHVTRLVIEDYHYRVGHSGMAHTWTSIRQNYWIVKGAATVRKVLGKCILCRRRNARAGQQMMSDLPKERVTPCNPPFYFSGVDYFGPFVVRQGRSDVKRYGCIFTCLTTRAVHIEVAHSLTTDSFIDAFRRFVSRRGTPHTLYSDNGTNFVGAERELRESIQEWNQSRITERLLQRSVRWKFNPPLASHMGGIWERLIRSVRRILYVLLSQQKLNDERLTTLMTEVEYILNSRPLTPITLDPEGDEPLTPNHLLLLGRCVGLPPGVFGEADNYCRRRWRQVQYLADQFWKRWTLEYLQTLQTRQKWQSMRRNLSPNELVLLVDENLPRGQWQIGRITEVHPDRQGRVRQVSVRTGTGIIMKRPVTKLCTIIDIDDDEKMRNV